MKQRTWRKFESAGDSRKRRFCFLAAVCALCHFGCDFFVVCTSQRNRTILFRECAINAGPGGFGCPGMKCSGGFGGCGNQPCSDNGLWSGTARLQFLLQSLLRSLRLPVL